MAHKRVTVKDSETHETSKSDGTSKIEVTVAMRNLAILLGRAEVRALIAAQTNSVANT